MDTAKRKRSGDGCMPPLKDKGSRLDRQHKPPSKPSIVSPAVLQNHPRQTFFGPIHIGAVSCGHECWHELVSTEPTVHNAFLTLPLPSIGSLNLPQSRSNSAADCNDFLSFEPANTVVFGQARLSQNSDQISVPTGFSATANTGFLTLNLSSTSLTETVQKERSDSSHALTSSNLDSVGSVPKPGEEPTLGFSASNKQAKRSLGIETQTAQLSDRITYTASNSLDRSNTQPPFIALQPPANHQTEGWTFDEDMAPVRNPENVQASIKDVIQILYDMQSQVHGFVPETQSILIDKVSELATSLSHLQTLTSKQESPNNPIHDIRIAPEFIDYVDDGRNPDIYTRDFVELVQRGNSVVNGKQQAFRDFSEIYAKALKEGFVGLGKDVDMVMANAELDGGSDSKQSDRRNGQQS